MAGANEDVEKDSEQREVPEKRLTGGNGLAQMPCVQQQGTQCSTG